MLQMISTCSAVSKNSNWRFINNKLFRISVKIFFNLHKCVPRGSFRSKSKSRLAQNPVSPWMSDEEEVNDKQAADPIQDFHLALTPTQAETMTKEVLGYLIPCTKIVDRNFAGAVSVPVGWVPGNLYDRLCLMFKKANIKKILDEIDFEQKAGNEVLKIKSAKTKMEESMLQKLSSLEMWSLEEVQEWLEVDKRNSEEKKTNGANTDQKSESKNGKHIPPNTGANEVPGPSCKQAGEKEKDENVIQKQMMSDFGISKSEVVDFQSEKKQVAVKLKIGENIYELNDKILEECLVALDLNGGDTNMTKDELAKLGLKLIPFFIEENIVLRDQVRDLKDSLVKKEEQIKDLRKDAFNANTRELLLGKEVEKMKEERAERTESQQPSMMNKMMVKLEGMEKVMKESKAETKEFKDEMVSQVAAVKVNSERAVDILGGLKKDLHKEKWQTTCRVKVTQKLEEAQKMITFCGSADSVKYLERAHGELRRDLESLKKKGLILVEATEQPGVENLAQLLKKTGEKRSAAFIMLNMGAETAEMFLDDQEYGSNAAIKLKITAKRLAVSAKENFERIVFIIPPHTPQSHGFIQKLSETLLGEESIEIIDISKKQKEMAEGMEDDLTWKLEDGRSLKQCCIVDDEVREGWNKFSTNMMLTEVASLIAEKSTKPTYCGECGLGHTKNSHCQKEEEYHEDTKLETVDGSRAQAGEGTSGGSRGTQQREELPEECLKCFRAHDSENKCRVSENMMCNYPECYRKGHMRAVHYPKKKSTIDRLFAKYTSNFPIVYPDNGRKRENNRDSSRDSKRTREDRQDRSR